jgi:hypothetical protein
LGRAQVSNRRVFCFPCAEGCRPGANVERQVKLFLTGLFLSELGET